MKHLLGISVAISLLLMLAACQNEDGTLEPTPSPSNSQSSDESGSPGVSVNVEPSTTFNALLDNEGTEFILAFLPNLSAPSVELHLTSTVATNVTVQYPVNLPTFTMTVAVVPGSVTTVSLPNAAAQSWPLGSVANNAVRAFADEEFIVYMINRAPFTSDAALGLPVDTMNTEYIVLDINSDTPLNNIRAEFNVYGAFDATTVTITPSQAFDSGQAAGVPFVVVLNRGEGITFRAAVDSGVGASLTGTVVSADRPIGVTNGHNCTNVGGVTACDHVFEVAQPVQTWGNQVLVANLPNRPSGSIYRILASEDGTTVRQNGAVIGLIDRGQFLQVGPVAGNHSFSADMEKAIYVAQFMTGVSSPGATLGDPAMGNMIPFAQYLSEYTFSTVGGRQFVQNFVTIIAEDADVGTLTLDGVAVPAADFNPIGSSGFSAAAIEIVDGTHTTASTGVHGITVEGYNQADSYIYPGGALFQIINPVGDANPPIVTLTPDAGDFSKINGLAEDNRPSEDVNNNNILDPGEDLNGDGLIDEDTGILSVELGAGSTNLSLTVDPFVPGDGTVTFMVQLTDTTLDGSGSVVVSDLNGNITTEPVAISSKVPFAVFDIEEAEVELDEDGDEFEVEGRFVAASAIDVLNEDVTVTFDGFSVTIPAGLFVRDEEDQCFEFEGGATGITEVEICDDGRFEVEGEGLDLSGIDFTNPVLFFLQIGNDCGETEIPFTAEDDDEFEFEADDDDDDEDDEDDEDDDDDD